MLTKRQVRILEDSINVFSINSVQYHLRTLAREGYITIDRGQHRGISLVERDQYICQLYKAVKQDFNVTVSTLEAIKYLDRATNNCLMVKYLLKKMPDMVADDRCNLELMSNIILNLTAACIALGLSADAISEHTMNKVAGNEAQDKIA